MVPVMYITYRLWQHQELLLVMEAYSTKKIMDFIHSDARRGMDHPP